MARWLVIVLSAATLVAACTDDKLDDSKNPSEEDPAVIDSTGPFAAVAGGKTAVAAFPNDLYTVEDTKAYTGLKVNIDLDEKDLLVKEVKSNPKIIDRINALDGFGTSAGGWIRFEQEVDEASVEDNKSVFLGYLDGTHAEIVPAEVLVYEHQIGFRPYFPIPPMAQAFMLSTTDVKTTDGDAFKPNPELQAILQGKYSDAHVTVSTTLAERIHDTATLLVDNNIVKDTDAISSLTVFTTQSIHQTDLEVAKVIQDFEPTVHIDDSKPACEAMPDDNVRKCLFSITIRNFTSSTHIIDDNAADRTQDSGDGAYTYDLRVVAYLPLENAQDLAADKTDEDDAWIVEDITKGYPVAIFGHGLSQSADDALLIARFTAPLGMATISIDAPQHGEHPMRISPDGDQLTLLKDLFGINTNKQFTVDAFRLRDAWRQSDFDKLGLLQVLKQKADEIDLDGDGNRDFNPDQVSYLGASLGAIQAPEFMALSSGLDMGVLAVGGARISDFLRYDGLVSAVAVLLAPDTEADGNLRLYALLQTAIERGDPINWAPYVLQNRFQDPIDAGNPFHLIMQQSTPDEIVPQETGLNLVRTLGVPNVNQTVWLPDPFIEETPATSPISGNGPDGLTFGMIQIHWLHKFKAPEEWRPTEHADSPDSIEGIAFWKHIFRTMYTDGKPELIDPFLDATFPE